MGARYYDPRNGRFLSEDPNGFAAGDVNLYRYVTNDPISMSDPSGLESSSRTCQAYPGRTYTPNGKLVSCFSPAPRTCYGIPGEITCSDQTKKDCQKENAFDPSERKSCDSQSCYSRCNNILCGGDD